MNHDMSKVKLWDVEFDGRGFGARHLTVKGNDVKSATNTAVKLAKTKWIHYTGLQSVVAVRLLGEES